jgi:hypothetical protein
MEPATEPAAEPAAEPAVEPRRMGAAELAAREEILSDHLRREVTIYEWVKSQANHVHAAEMTDAMARLSTEHPPEPPARETLSPEPRAAPHAPGPAPDQAQLWVALEALAGPAEPKVVDQVVRAARAAARPLAARLLALEAGGGGLGLALAGLLEPVREK